MSIFKALGPGLGTDALFRLYNSLFFLLSLIVFTLMVTIHERERIILSILYLIPSSSIYKKVSTTAIAGTERKWELEKKKIMKFWQGENGTPFFSSSPQSWKTCITRDTTSFSEVNDEKWHGEKKFLRTVSWFGYLSEPQHPKIMQEFSKLVRTLKERKLTSFHYASISLFVATEWFSSNFDMADVWALANSHILD